MTSVCRPPCTEPLQMPADHKLSPCSEQPRVLYLVAYKRRTSDAEPLALSQHPTKMAHSAGQVTTMTRQTDTWADRMAMFLEVTCVDNRIGGNAPLHPMLRSRHIRSAFRSPKRRRLGGEIKFGSTVLARNGEPLPEEPRGGAETRSAAGVRGGRTCRETSFR